MRHTCSTGTGVRRGCILSPYPCSLGTECITQKPGLDSGGGVQTGGRNTGDLSYAADPALRMERSNDLK